MPVIILMRHAKSAYPPGIADHDRPLSDRGRANAEVAAQWFASQRSMDHLSIDTALISTATRTRQTWDIVAPSVHPTEVVYLPGLYHASPEVIAHQVQLRQETCVLVIGHNPGLHELARSFVPEQALQHGVLDRFPTSAIAVVNDGVLVDVVIPR